MSASLSADLNSSAIASLWRPAGRAARLTPSIIRDLLAVTEQPGMVSLAGGLPAPETFPVELVRDACARVLADAPQAALQYANSEGYGPLREWIAADLLRQGMHVLPRQVLITNGSQQGLDLAAKVLIDEGSSIGIERPCYLGALQAFAPHAPAFHELTSDDRGVLGDAFTRCARRRVNLRFAYLVPTFQNPTGKTLDEARRNALVADAQRNGVPLLEDNPYGELWCDAPPPAPIAARWPEGTLYLGSFSKMLAPGLRLGYLVLPDALWPQFQQAKQASDLHTSGFAQRIAHAVLTDPRFAGHCDVLRTHYRKRRDAMDAALHMYMPAECAWTKPAGGMFFWLRLPPGHDADALLARALAARIAFVPGRAFHAHTPDARTLRLSYVTIPPQELERAINMLGALIRDTPRTAIESREEES